MESNLLFQKPIHLLQPTEDRSKLMLNPDALKALKSITGPVVLVAIVGNQRGGKSTLLNLMHSRQTSGFGLGHSYDAQTTGFWVWARKHPRNEDLTVILMDTEGLDTPHSMIARRMPCFFFSLSVPQWYNWALASLALLVSSFFIYQSKGSIDSSATDRLAVILSVAEQIGGNPDDIDPAETDSPHFLWLIRDSQLQFKNPPKQEMLKMLQRNEKRQLEGFFKTHDCFPLPRPVDSEDKLKEVETLAFETLRSEFREEYGILERQIFTAIVNPTKVKKQQVTGEFLGSLLENYVAILGREVLKELSQLPTQSQLIMKMQGEKAVNSAVKEYQTNIDLVAANLPLPESQIVDYHAKFYKSARATFIREVRGDENSGTVPKEVEEFFATFNDKIAIWRNYIALTNGAFTESKRLDGGLYFEFIQKNLALSKNAAQKKLSELYSGIDKKVKGSEYTNLEEYLYSVEEFKKSFHEDCQETSASKELFANFLEQRVAMDVQKLNLLFLERKLVAQIAAQHEKQIAMEASVQEKINVLENLIASKVLALTTDVTTQISKLSNATNEQMNELSNNLNKKINESDNKAVTEAQNLRAATIQLKEDVNKNKLDLQTLISENALESKNKFSEFTLNLNGTKEEILQKSKEKFVELENALQESQKKNDSKLTEISQKTSSLVEDAKEELTKKSKERFGELENLTTENQKKIAGVSDNLEAATKKLAEQIESNDKRLCGSLTDLTEGIAKRCEKIESAQQAGDERWSEQLQKSVKKLQDESAERAEAQEKRAKEIHEKVDAVEKKLQAEAGERAENLEKRLKNDGEALEKKWREHEAKSEEIQMKFDKKVLSDAAAMHELNKSVEASFETVREEARNTEKVVRLNLEKIGADLVAQCQKLEVQINDRLIAVESDAKLGIAEGQTAREEVKNSEAVVKLNVEKIGSDILGQFQTFNALFSERLEKVEHDAKVGIAEAAAAKEEVKNAEDVVKANVEKMGSELIQQFQTFNSLFSGRLEQVESDAKLGISEGQTAREELKNSETVVKLNLEKIGTNLIGQFEQFNALFSSRLESVENAAKASTEEGAKRDADLSKQQETIVQLASYLPILEQKLTDSATSQQLETAKTELEKLARAFTQLSAVTEEQRVVVQEALKGLEQKSSDSLLVMNNCVTELFNAKKQTMEVDERLEAFKLESSQLRESSGQGEASRGEELARVKADIAVALQEVSALKEALVKRASEELVRFEQFKDEANASREETEKSLLESTKGYTQGIEQTMTRLESQWKQSLQEVEAHVKSESERRAHEMQQLLLVQRADTDDSQNSAAKIQALSQEIVHQQEIEKKLVDLSRAIEIIEKSRQEDKVDSNKCLCEFREKYDLSLASIEQIVTLNNTETLLKVSNILSKIEALESERANAAAIQPVQQPLPSFTPIAGPESETNPSESKPSQGGFDNASEWRLQLEGLKTYVTQSNAETAKIRVDLDTKITILDQKCSAIDIKVLEFEALKERVATADNVSSTCSVGLARLQSVTKEMFLKVEKTFVAHNEKIEETSLSYIGEQLQINQPVPNEPPPQYPGFPTSPPLAMNSNIIFSNPTSPHGLNQSSSQLLMSFPNANPSGSVGSASPVVDANLSKRLDQLNQQLLEQLNKIELLQVANEVLKSEMKSVQSGGATNISSSSSSPFTQKSLQDIQSIIDEQMVSQRKELVDAMKKHISSVEQKLGKDIASMQDTTRTLLRNWEEKFKSTVGSGGGDQGSILALGEKIDKTKVEINNIRNSFEAVWNSIAQISSKVTEIEAELDR